MNSVCKFRIPCIGPRLLGKLYSVRPAFKWSRFHSPFICSRAQAKRPSECKRTRFWFNSLSPVCSINPDSLKSFISGLSNAVSIKLPDLSCHWDSWLFQSACNAAQHFRFYWRGTRIWTVCFNGFHFWNTEKTASNWLLPSAWQKVLAIRATFQKECSGSGLWINYFSSAPPLPKFEGLAERNT